MASAVSSTGTSGSGPVHPGNVDVIGAQPTQRVINFQEYPVTGCIAVRPVRRAHSTPVFVATQYLVATSRDCRADDFSATPNP